MNYDRSATHDSSGCVPPRLVVMSEGPFRGLVLILENDRNVVGRLVESDLRLDHPHVSGTHARLDRSYGRTVLEDLGSTRGTSVNGHPVDSPRVLHHGDVVRFGSVEALYAEPSEPCAVLTDPRQPDQHRGSPASAPSPRAGSAATPCPTWWA
jgi:pSer/pThr/pTyr-binding forkhead associated (FHA) protein